MAIFDLPVAVDIKVNTISDHHKITFGTLAIGDLINSSGGYSVTPAVSVAAA